MQDKPESYALLISGIHIHYFARQYSSGQSQMGFWLCRHEENRPELPHWGANCSGLPDDLRQHTGGYLSHRPLECGGVSTRVSAAALCNGAFP